MLSGLLWMGNLFALFALIIHLYSLATDPANIFSSRLHAVFPERIFLSATDFIKGYSEHHRKGIYWTPKHKATRGRHDQSWKVPPWGVSRLGTKTFPPNTRQVHCWSIYKMADEIQSPAKKRRKTEKTGSDLDDKLESKQQSAKKSGKI